MKTAILFLTVCLATEIHACDKTYDFQVGPFFSTSSILRYWQDFALEVGKKTGCKIQLVTTTSYEQYLETILNKEHHIYIAPDHFIKAFIQLGYKPILMTDKTAQIYLVSKHNLKQNDLSDLEGDEILVPSIYTRAYLELDKWLNEKGLNNKVTFDFNHSHDSAALIMLKGKKSTTVMLSAIYRALPETIKTKHSAIVISAKAGAYLHIRPDLPKEIIAAIQSSSEHLHFHNWSLAAPPYDEPFQDAFIQQLTHFKRKAIN